MKGQMNLLFIPLEDNFASSQTAAQRHEAPRLPDVCVNLNALHGGLSHRSIRIRSVVAVSLCLTACLYVCSTNIVFPCLSVPLKDIQLHRRAAAEYIYMY